MNNQQTILVGDRAVGPAHRPYVIAEIGSNHNGDMNLARKLIVRAKECGADAVKFQSWSTTSLISRAEYARNTEYADKDRHFGTLYEMVERYQLTPEQHYEIAEICREVGIHFLSSAFCPEEVDLLVEVGCPALKIASMDVNHPVLLAAAAKSGKPIILSTGLSSLDEVSSAVRTLEDNGCKELILLHCISIYPPEPKDVNLRNIPMLRQAFGVPIGFSDHSLGTHLAVASVALGACMIEKHYTLDKTMDGWDHWMSADPEELERLCSDVNDTFEALGESTRQVSSAEMEKRRKFRRCIVLREALKSGHELTLEDLDFKRPGTGIRPDEYPYVLGRRLARDLDADHELSWVDLA
jgi:N,N'-diacetyllegionaminate synthase